MSFLVLMDPEPDGFIRRPGPLLAESGYHLSSCRATGDLDRPAASSRIGGLQPLDEPGTSVRRPFPCGIHDRVDVFYRWPNHGLSSVHNHKPARWPRAAELRSGRYGRPRSSPAPGRDRHVRGCAMAFPLQRNDHALRRCFTTSPSLSGVVNGVPGIV